MLVRAGASVLGLRLGQALLNAAAGWLVAHRLGADGQGRYALVLMLVLLFSSLLNGGVGLAAVPRLKRDSDAVGPVLSAQGRWFLLVAPLLVALAVCLGARWGGLVPTAGGGGSVLGFAAAGLAAFALLVFEVLVSDITACGRVTLGPAVNLARACLNLAFLLGLARLDRLGPAEAVAAYAVAHAAAALAVVFLVRREVRPETAPAARVGASELWREGRVGQLSSVISLLHLRLDLWLVAAWHGPAVVGLYSVAVLAGELLWMLPGALQPVVIYTSGGAGRDEVTARAVRLGTAASVLGALVMALLAKPVFHRVFAGEYDAAVPALLVLLPGIVLFAPGAVLAGDFVGRGRSAWNTQAGLVTVLANVVAGLLLIRPLGAVGAALASTLAYAVASTVMLARFRRVSGLSWSRILLPRTSDLGRH